MTGEQSAVEEMWRMALTSPHLSRFAFLPSSPRCVLCREPFGGVGGRLLHLLGHRPSRKNPNLCNLCDDLLPQGGAEIDVAVLFADVRGSTTLAEQIGARAFAGTLNRFYKAATDILLAHDAMIDKMVGDEVMALFIPSVCRGRHRWLAAESAMQLLGAVGYGEGEAWLPVGVGVHAGPAFVGKVGTSGVNDFTALGDTVNTAARLQSEAAAGEAVLSEAVCAEMTERLADCEQRFLTLRGRSEPVAVRVYRPPAAVAR